jgi:hypothetical protein
MRSSNTVVSQIQAMVKPDVTGGDGLISRDPVRTISDAPGDFENDGSSENSCLLLEIQEKFIVNTCMLISFVLFILLDILYSS